MLKDVLKSTVVRVTVLTIVVFFFALFISLKLKNNELETKAAALRDQIADVNDSINELETMLARPFDDEYVEEIARDKLGLRYPQEIIFYSGEGQN